MKTNMKQFTSFLLLMFLATGYTSAQPSSLPVEPGSKGNLPTLSAIAPLEEGHFAGLWFETTHAGYTTNNQAYFSIARFSFPSPEVFGGHGYYLERANHGTNSWIPVDNTGLIRTEGDGYTIQHQGTADYRLRLEGGPMNNYVSNVVTVDIPSSDYVTLYSGWSMAEDDIKAPGQTIGGSFLLTTDSYLYGKPSNGKHEYNVEDGYYVYQWYRQNPKTYELTPIAGATNLEYTLTMDDCGYVMVLETKGDGTHCAFDHYVGFGYITLPVKASIEYIGNDGFIINTDYVLPLSDNTFFMTEDFYFPGELPKPVTEGVIDPNLISVCKPGQYAFRIPSEDYDYKMLDINIPGMMLNTSMLAEWLDEPREMYREFQLMSDRYQGPINVTTTFNGQPVQATLEFYGYDMDNNPTLALTTTTDQNGVVEIYEGNGLYKTGRGYIVKALATNFSETTYYPSALVWSEGQMVVPQYDEEWNPTAITIELRPTLPILTGTGVIEGRVNVSAQPAHARRMAPAVTTGINVYLQQKGGDIIASEETTATGSYRFEHVPMGSYEVLVNVDGCMQEESTEVTLTNEQPTVSDVDYYVNEDNTITTTPGSQTPTAIAQHATATTQQWYDLSGRRLRHPQPGVNIVKGTDGTVRRIIMR